MASMEDYLKLLRAPEKPIKIGNTNKTGKCGMCGINVKKLYPQKVGQVDFMICGNCKCVFDITK